MVGDFLSDMARENGHVECDLTGNEYFILKENVTNGLAILREKCRKANISTRVLDYVTYKKPDKYITPGILNFLCLHNRCGNLQPNDCNNFPCS